MASHGFAALARRACFSEEDLNKHPDLRDSIQEHKIVEVSL